MLRSPAGSKGSSGDARSNSQKWLDWGGARTTVTGSAFLPGATLTFGNAEATKAVVASSSRITAVTGPHPAGSKALDVTVTNPDGQSGSRARTFKYVASPARKGSPSKQASR